MFPGIKLQTVAIFSLITGFFWQDSVAQTDLEKWNLKGPVKSVRELGRKIPGDTVAASGPEESIFLFNPQGNMQKISYRYTGNRMIGSVYYYDRRGYLMREELFESDSKKIRKRCVKGKYDAQNRLVKQRTTEKGKTIRRYVCQYNEAGKKEEVDYGEFRFVHEYHTNGTKKGYKRYRSDGTLSIMVTYNKYDDWQNVLEYTDTNLKTGRTFTTTYTYTYDAVGNWVKKSEWSNGRPISVTERILEYYP